MGLGLGTSTVGVSKLSAIINESLYEINRCNLTSMQERKQRNRWKDSEARALALGVLKCEKSLLTQAALLIFIYLLSFRCGAGKWAAILKDEQLSQLLSERSQVDLKVCALLFIIIIVVIIVVSHCTCAGQMEKHRGQLQRQA